MQVVWQKVRSWLKMSSPILTLTIVDQEVRYVVRQGTHVSAQGSCMAPQAFQGGRLVAPDILAQSLFSHLSTPKGQVGKVAVLLPTSWLQLHEVTLPAGLDAEELNYQINRYVTYNLNLNPTEIFFDWTVLNADADKRLMTVLLAVARQSDVALFHRVFVDTDWHLQWVCPEPQVWSVAYRSHATMDRPVGVCQIEPHGLAFWLIESDGSVRSFLHPFNEQESAGFGFVYQSSHEADSWVRFPSKFVGDLLAQHLPNWLGTISLNELNKVYATGKGVNWSEVIPMLQSRFGVPFRLAEESFGIDSEEAQPKVGMAGLWWLSKQVAV